MRGLTVVAVIVAVGDGSISGATPDLPHMQISGKYFWDYLKSLCLYINKQGKCSKLNFKTQFWHRTAATWPHD